MPFLRRCKPEKGCKISLATLLFSGAAGRNRTHDPLVRSQVLYPTELRARNEVVIIAKEWMRLLAERESARSLFNMMTRKEIFARTRCTHSATHIRYRERPGMTAGGPESVTRHSRGTRPLIAPCHKAPPSPSPSDMRSLGCECYRDAHKEDGSELTGNRSMGTPALGGSQPDPLSGIQRWPRIVATEMAAARRSR